VHQIFPLLVKIPSKYVEVIINIDFIDLDIFADVFYLFI